MPGPKGLRGLIQGEDTDIGKRLPIAGRPGLRIGDRLSPGDIEGVVRSHGSIYASEYGFDRTFERYVAEPLARFAGKKTDRERIWLVDDAGSLKGSIAIVEHSRAAAQLRWFLLHPDLRGLGLGKLLVEGALRNAGFTLAEEKASRLWGRELLEQRYQLSL